MRRLPGIARRFALPIAACLLICGCYTFSGSTLPAHLRTVVIRPLQNNTLQSTLGDDITNALIEGFQRRSNLRKVNQNGDAEFVGVVQRYSHEPLSLSGDQVTTYRVDIMLQARFLDNVREKVLYEDKGIPGYGQYSVLQGETEETGRRRAIESIVQVILDNTVSGW